MPNGQQGNGRCCCGGKCDCQFCTGGENVQCLRINFSGFAALDLSTGNPCYHCGNFNNAITLGYEGGCVWMGSFCRPDDPDRFFDSCGVKRVHAEIERSGSPGSYSYILRVKFQGEAPFTFSIIDLAVWEHDYGNLGSGAPDCLTGFPVECTLISNDLECEVPEEIIVEKHSGQCVGSTLNLGSGFSPAGPECGVCKNSWTNEELNLPWWVPPGFDQNFFTPGPHFLVVSIGGVTSIPCPDCTETCDACDEICGDEPACPDNCDCINTCQIAGWGSFACLSCWGFCDGNLDCYNAWQAHFACMEGEEYTACVAACEECEGCVECVGCDEAMEFRLVQVTPFTDTCGWSALCNSNEQICSEAFDSTPVKVNFIPQTIDFDAMNPIVIEVTLNNSVKWSQQLCDDCWEWAGGAYFPDNINCLNLEPISEGWTLEILDTDASDVCVWDAATVTVTPELPTAMVCRTRSNNCLGCEGPESRWTRYLVVTIPAGWLTNTCSGCPVESCVANLCAMAVGEFVLEAQIGVSAVNTGSICSYRYLFTEEDGQCPEFDEVSPCPDPENACCLGGFIEASIYDGEDGFVYVQISIHAAFSDQFNLGGGTCYDTLFTWRAAIAYKYGAEGAQVIDCDAIDHDAPLVSQYTNDDFYPHCAWDAGESLHVESFAG